MRGIQVAFILVLLMWTRVHCAPFQNLGFEEANVPTSGTELQFFSAAEAIPGWKLFDQGHEAGRVIGVNLFPPGVPTFGGQATLVSTNNSPAFIAPELMEGAYSFVFEPSYDLSSWPYQVKPMWIEQAGEIPASAKTIRFEKFYAPVSVEINGMEVALEFSFPGPPGVFEDPNGLPAHVAGDISRFAGQTVELRIAPVGGLALPYFVHGIDSFRFSAEPIPEPHTVMIFGAGIAVLAFTFATRSRRLSQKYRNPSAN